MKPGWVYVTLISGVEGDALYINDRRVVGPKPWGGGTVMWEKPVRIEDMSTFEEARERLHDSVAYGYRYSPRKADAAIIEARIAELEAEVTRANASMELALKAGKNVRDELMTALATNARLVGEIAALRERFGVVE